MTLFSTINLSTPFVSSAKCLTLGRILCGREDGGGVRVRVNGHVEEDGGERRE
jgi:hypothetical protein